MDSEERKHLAELLHAYKRRLWALEEQAAKFGSRTEPQILNEIQDLRTLIAQTSGQLDVSALRPDDIPAPACPYPGMVQYGQDDAHRFYGRDSEIQHMLRHLRYHRMLLVIGPSGSGKSSLVFAGLLPKLQNSHLFQPGYWCVRTMRPGRAPVHDFGQALAQAGQSEPDIAAFLAAHPPAQRLLLIVDQFEELFTQTTPIEQQLFLALLKRLYEDKRCALIILVRADFYGDLIDSELWELVSNRRLDIAPLRGTALRTAIERPASDAGVQLDAELLERLLADAADEPGLLPLVQETMVLLWGMMSDRRLTLRAYEELRGAHQNGLAVALANRADAVLADLSPDQQAIARRIFLRLIHFGEGRPDTRRQQPLTALLTAEDDPEIFGETLHHLVENRLLILGANGESLDKKVDIAHEALITGWPVLQRWRNELWSAEQTRRRLEQKVAEWMRLGQGSGGLLDEIELVEAEQWLGSADAVTLGYDENLAALVQASSSRKNLLAQTQQMVDSLQGDRNQLAAILESTAEGIITCDMRGVVLTSNQTAAEILQLSQQQVLGRPLELLINDLHGRAVEVVTRALGSSEHISGVDEKAAVVSEIELSQPWHRYIRHLALPMRDAGGTIYGQLIVFRDITYEKELEQLREDYTNLLIHDLRAPLTSIMNGVMMVRRGLGGPVTETQQELLQIAYQGGQIMLELVNNLLDISKMEQGRLKLELDPIAPSAIVERAIEHLQLSAQSQHVEIVQKLALDLPAIEADGDKIVRALQNLIDNAIRYSPSGAVVTVGAHLYAPGHALPTDTPLHPPVSQAEWLIFWVQDRGMGIPTAYHDQIFDKFGQVRGRKMRGAGLGLAYCRLTIEAHGGRIWVESQEDQGSTFAFALPLAQERAPAATTRG